MDAEALAEGAGTPDFVIHARGLEPSADLAAAQERGVIDLLHFTHRLNALPEEEQPKVCVLTRGVFEVTENEGVADIFSSTLPGFLRVARGEHPAAFWKHIDFDPEGSEFEPVDLLEEIEFFDAEQEVAYRGGNRFGSRLLPLKEEDAPLLSREAVSADGTVAPYRLQISTPGMLTDRDLPRSTRMDPGLGGAIAGSPDSTWMDALIRRGVPR